MVVCVIALIIFSFLGIFSVRYRKLAKEAFNCVFRRITLRPCETGFDKRMKMKIISKSFKFSPKLSKVIYKHFEGLSWIFTILLVVSLVVSANGIYNLAIYGVCDPHSTQCIINPGAVGCGDPECEPCLCEDVTCESPEYLACEGNCECIENVCG
ncbi:MAG: hypothetical protein ACE5J4_01310 [Candidatus Aenigmatarchaeota archaeon]